MRSTAAESTAIALEVDPNVAAQVVGVALVDEHGVPQSVLTTRATRVDPRRRRRQRAGAGARRQLPGAHARRHRASSRRRSAIGSTRRCRQPGRYRLHVRAAADPDPGRVRDQRSGSARAYENLELHDAVVAFSVEGDDLGRHRLVKVGTNWTAERIDARRSTKERSVSDDAPAVTCVLIFLDGARFIDEAIRSVVAQGGRRRLGAGPRRRRQHRRQHGDRPAVGGDRPPDPLPRARGARQPGA